LDPEKKLIMLDEVIRKLAQKETDTRQPNSTHQI